jgi:hypothetical protein
MRVAAAGLRTKEVAVGQRRRAGGVSKVSGSAAAVRAAAVLVSTFVRLALGLRRSRRAIAGAPIDADTQANGRNSPTSR